MYKLPAQWQTQNFIQLMFPHQNSDWGLYLDEVLEVFENIALTIAKYQLCLVCYSDEDSIENIYKEYENKEWWIYDRARVTGWKRRIGEIYPNFTEEDLKEFKENWDDLASTISAMVRIININGETKIIIGSAGGSSALNLLGRFAHADKELHDYINQIAKKEEELNPDKLLAEIVHLPESRIGNILARPVFRKYEIPYLAQSAVDTEHQIPVSDIMVSVKQNKIILRSKKYNKDIQPHLSNAHNFSSNALPVYQFLADMQTQNIRGGIYFSWGALENEYDFLPRVSYKNIIFSEATWVVKKEEYENIIKLTNDKEIFNR